MNTGRKLFFGLFIFPLLIAVGMAVLLCSVVLLTSEEESPESLVTAIKTGSPSKRWQKAFELSNELQRTKSGIRSQSVLREIIHILTDADHYDPKTRGYMALALSHFPGPEAVKSLRRSLRDPHEDVALYSLWTLGVLGAREAAPDVLNFLKEDRQELRKMAAYVLGVIGDGATAPFLRPLLDDPAQDVQWNAALSLARLGDDSGAPILLKMIDRRALAGRFELSDAAVENIMINAAKGLALIKEPQSIKILESISKNDKSLKVRQAAMDAREYQRSYE